MNIKVKFCLFSLLSIVFVSAYAQGQEMGGARNVAAMKLTTIPPLPTCARGSVQSGDPSKGESIIFAKINTGCTIPWHWHTPDEHVMVISGTVRMAMKDAKTVTLTAGGFALMPSKHIHQFNCIQSCQIYVYSNSAFDLHYVNKKGDEITPAAAMKAVKQMAATEMK